ncbi:hypothetical protein CCACVL1_20030, partial [Corchorus capsularis]
PPPPSQQPPCFAAPELRATANGARKLQIPSPPLP